MTAAMNIKQSTVILALTLGCSACAFVPKTDSHQPYANKCDMVTKRLTLDKPTSNQTINCQKDMHGGDFVSCLVIAGVIIPAGSLVISGSIVLVNNTIHWLEYQGSCDKRQLTKNTQAFKQQIHTPIN